MTQSAQSLIRPESLDLKKLNQKFENLHPRDILGWCIAHIPESLVQASAFSVDDMLITDLLYRELQPANPVPVLFLDTLYHFPQTLELVAQAKELYHLNLKVYKIKGVSSRKAFAKKYGEALWETDVAKFHQLTKVEPLQRGLKELNAIAWITGRRRDQSETRVRMPIFELDGEKRLKVNPLANWTRKETWAYVFEHDVIYNPLHDQGYSSIGDEPLTAPIQPGEGERVGRWQGTDTTECGIHF
jgi:phosphoadenosine phosphosulfate reductase